VEEDPADSNAVRPTLTKANCRVWDRWATSSRLVPVSCSACPHPRTQRSQERRIRPRVHSTASTPWVVRRPQPPRPTPQPQPQTVLSRVTFNSPAVTHLASLDGQARRAQPGGDRDVGVRDPPDHPRNL